jgi:hypothetical protein
MTDTTTPETCGWLVERAVPWADDPDWYPDFPEDTYQIVECGEPVAIGARYALCSYHHSAMDLPEDEFDRISEMHDGRAFS